MFGELLVHCTMLCVRFEARASFAVTVLCACTALSKHRVHTCGTCEGGFAALLDTWARLCRVWTIGGRSSAALLDI